MARLEFGLDDFLYGSCSAFCGSTHVIPRRVPSKPIQADASQCGCSKENTRESKALSGEDWAGCQEGWRVRYSGEQGQQSVANVVSTLDSIEHRSLAMA
jgi:hypothetical protein